MSESSSVLRGRVCEDWLTSLKTSLTYVTESSDAQHASEEEFAAGVRASAQAETIKGQKFT